MVSSLLMGYFTLHDDLASRVVVSGFASAFIYGRIALEPFIGATRRYTILPVLSTAMAGFGLLYDVASGTTLTGFLHINGSLEFLGVVSLTVELDLELSYQVEAKILAGTASLEVDIEVAFFSVSVGFTLHREISVDSGIGTNAVNHALGSGANAGGRILMGDLVTDAAQWSTYCSAFA